MRQLIKDRLLALCSVGVYNLPCRHLLHIILKLNFSRIAIKEECSNILTALAGVNICTESCAFPR